jgi:hypothetical protein
VRGRHAPVRASDGLLQSERDFPDATGGPADSSRATRAASRRLGVDRDLVEQVNERSTACRTRSTSSRTIQKCTTYAIAPPTRIAPSIPRSWLALAPT